MAKMPEGRSSPRNGDRAQDKKMVKAGVGQHESKMHPGKAKTKLKLGGKGKGGGGGGY